MVKIALYNLMDNHLVYRGVFCVVVPAEDVTLCRVSRRSIGFSRNSGGIFDRDNVDWRREKFACTYS